MTPLEALVQQATAATDPDANATEVARVMQICNACRYCEGFCAVFPAMTRRLAFNQPDIDYLANLCHGCGACLPACQYASPHEFAVNVPRAMARVRVDSYARYAWPQALGALYRRNGLTLLLALLFGCAMFLVLGYRVHGARWLTTAGSFYDTFSHRLMVTSLLPAFAFAVIALTLGARRFWRAVTPGTASGAATREAAGNALRLKYLDGGHGDGCNESDDAFTLQRRRYHHLTFYGFTLCFAATTVATLYHYGLNRPAPYGYSTWPKLLGISGGVALVIGTAGLMWLNLRRAPAQSEAAQRPMDRGFTALLFGIASSGLALAALRDTRYVPTLLTAHLGAVMALFLTLPYGKFAHGIYRSAALLKWAVERRRPNELRLGDD